MIQNQPLKLEMSKLYCLLRYPRVFYVTYVHINYSVRVYILNVHPYTVTGITCVRLFTLYLPAIETY